ncbi:MAG: S-formylglutathione hydrolase, partial [Polaromonas sp.]|nr:S-formylglutathione hydrolase [Polaromonas sp.]
MAVETLSAQRCFGGVQGFYKHSSTVIGLPMRFGVYRPPQACGPHPRPVPVLLFLAGLTCNE